jgi:hypothetical protein
LYAVQASWTPATFRDVAKNGRLLDADVGTNAFAENILATRLRGRLKYFMLLKIENRDFERRTEYEIKCE